MRILLAFGALFLSGCCPRQDLRVEGGSKSSVLIYDPNTDTLYDVENETLRVKVWRNWNRPRD